MRQIAFGRPMIGEEEKQAVMDVLNNPILVHGPRAKQFEEDFATYTGAGKAVSVSSCTAAMHLAYFDLGIGPSDEVIVPAQTHTATAHAVELCGAKPVFVDAEIQSGNIDIDQIERAISDRTRAIAVVHYLGVPVRMDRVNQIARKYRLFVLEDCALSVGASFKGVHTGLHGNVGCFSFYPVKNITTAEGGMLITHDTDLAERINRKKAFGVDRFVGERKIPGVYDVNMLGFNYRMNEIQAAIGVEQVKKIDKLNRTRELNFNFLYDQLAQIEEVNLFDTCPQDAVSSYYCLSILLGEKSLPKRFEIVQFLQDQGIGTSVYYPKPVPHMTYYSEKYGYNKESYPIASRISYGSIALSVGPHLGTEDMAYTAEKLKQAIFKFK